MLDVHPWVGTWMHNEFLDLGGEKISKSKGHVLVVDSLVERGIDPLAFRYFFLQAHYRQQQAFTLGGHGGGRHRAPPPGRPSRRGARRRRRPRPGRRRAAPAAASGPRWPTTSTRPRRWPRCGTRCATADLGLAEPLGVPRRRRPRPRASASPTAEAPDADESGSDPRIDALVAERQAARARQGLRHLRPDPRRAGGRGHRAGRHPDRPHLAPPLTVGLLGQAQPPDPSVRFDGASERGRTNGPCRIEGSAEPRRPRRRASGPRDRDAHRRTRDRRQPHREQGGRAGQGRRRRDRHPPGRRAHDRVHRGRRRDRRRRGSTRRCDAPSSSPKATEHPLVARSSSVLEDTAGSSMAGQFDSIIGIDGLRGLRGRRPVGPRLPRASGRGRVPDRGAGPAADRASLRRRALRRRPGDRAHRSEDGVRGRRWAGAPRQR